MISSLQQRISEAQNRSAELQRIEEELKSKKRTVYFNCVAEIVLSLGCLSKMEVKHNKSTKNDDTKGKHI